MRDSRGDLAPDVIEHELNKSFTYDEGKREYRLKADGAIGGSVSIGPISFGGNTKGSYSKRKFQSFLRQHQLEVQFDGKKIIPKKIWLQVVNTGDFSGDAVISSRSIYAI